MNNDFMMTWLWTGVLWIIGLCLAFLVIMSLNPAVGRELVIASSYGDQRDIKRTGERRIATGGLLDPSGNYVAHKTLPFGTRLTLTHGHRKLMVTVNDRGPFVRGRTLDLTPAANRFLQCSGLCRVKIEPWPPLPKPAPLPKEAFAWGEE